ncbi:MAG: periplasmic protein disulfide isomerase I [Candidatus Methanoperedens nitroreducens]|uniref:Periplasmic protein disulfide isomerase I n=1 Tax=Candidatus Methanoperedens nitratireducens TaxID=1392998 RepID=A0A0P8CCJ0_9EURY|nr:thioredoxin domain-containing protein [Candidatus Methanoperedens sp. BLZ2]KAB2946624.1 MAG: thioredoxin domain-containing protein [Candidatus Methanoperedens sp.]KPQ44657.1 MAG: periplasmic protein disulfide isomerase I [Candidatus Methanoperedens sp. BLZ1]MBZ0173959.1 thioredoxin domain-containing protein [Candidatus Methanoperedens nitroreducens]MCX9078938.1 thioredoxin domain-containing protein [Candidatus Methanoperedens sp.]
MAKKKQKIPEKKSGIQTIHIILALLVISALAIYFLNSGEKSTEKLPAGDYSKLSKPADITPSKVKIMEFMKFDCSHCYDLHKEMPQLLKKYGDKVEIKYISIVFPKQSTKSIEAYTIAEQMGKGEEMRDALFKAKFEQGMEVMESNIALETVAASIGLGTEFNQKLESGAAKNAANENLNLMKEYNVEGTPTVIVNGNLMVVPTVTNLDTVIGSLLSEQ